VVWCVKDTHGFGFTTDLTKDSINLIRGEELWDVTRRQDIVDVDKELVVNDLRVGQ
jgi:hypothetical protein